MQPRITNDSTRTFDVHQFSFESAGALERDNEYSGMVASPTLYIAFAAPRQARPVHPLSQLEVNYDPPIQPRIRRLYRY
ncbi:MAG TPA: hypothetical protein DIT03_13420 [Candidatus Accumulibacter sp.]|nr:hypothetical protein [Accumulibacter sp.]HCN69230.1 hypothetical protein [Accumulibacter sp.]